MRVSASVATFPGAPASLSSEFFGSRLAGRDAGAPTIRVSGIGSAKLVPNLVGAEVTRL
jgi:hypothetical protein